ncbi:MAG: biliverdin-producing heme oxygenase [Pseudomonadota bacterium]
MTIAVPSTYSAPIPTRMQRLREATRQAHARIEGALPLLDPKLTRARYGRVLEAFFGFYVGLEPHLLAVAGAHAADIELGRRGKVPLLCLDLHALGQTAIQIGALPRCADLPLAVTPSQALGVLYVLEGATLGGQVIGRNLGLALGLGAANGAAFFAGYGDETRAMWKRFSEHVDRSAALDSEALIASAVETFEKLRSWLVAAGKS